MMVAASPTSADSGMRTPPLPSRAVDSLPVRSSLARESHRDTTTACKQDDVDSFGMQDASCERTASV